ncbi:MAG: DMT family transporter [Proteobacteria bacterium]|nr:DMT family transporter [Pseudomonadota bacterium]
MTFANLCRLVALAAIWGASFLFVRLAVPSLGALWLTELRVGIAALAMLGYAFASGIELAPRRHWRAYLVIGLGNSALPFWLYAYSGQHLTAGIMGILNATTPFFSVVCGALWLGEKLTPLKLLGLALGIVGVTLVVGFGPLELTHEVILGALACVGATLCYALTTTWLKKFGQGVKPVPLGAAGLLVASCAIAPFLPAVPSAAAFTPEVLMAVAGISLLCSAVAYLLYFRLIDDLGPTRTMTVAFLIPLFAVLWGRVFLGEAIGAGTIVGGITVLAATALVIRR